MSDDPEPKGNHSADDDRMADAWQMPKPVFRSSEGVTPKNALRADDPSELHETPELGHEAMAEGVPQDPLSSPGPVKVKAADPKPKKGGCATSVLAIVGMVLIVIIAIVLVLVYMFYSASATDPFS